MDELNHLIAVLEQVERITQLCLLINNNVSALLGSWVAIIAALVAACKRFKR